MEKGKINLTMILFVISVILSIGILIYMYNQKVTLNNEIQKLQNIISEQEITIINLQNQIFNTSSDIIDEQSTQLEQKYDVIIEMAEIEKINYYDEKEVAEFYNNYKGKVVKIIGYVSNFGYNTLKDQHYINLGNSSTYKKKIYVIGYASDVKGINEINECRVGQKVSIVGTVSSDATYPIKMNNIYVFSE